MMFALLVPFTIRAILAEMSTFTMGFRQIGCTLGLMGLAVAGCDLTGQYEANFKKALEESGRRAVFDLSLHPDASDTLDPGKEVKLRLPKALDANSKWLKPAEPRAQLPFVQLPGLANVLERQLDDASQFLYVYFAAVPKTEGKADAVLNAVSQQVAAAFPGSSWTEISLPKPDGSSLQTRRLRVEGPQAFTNTAKKAQARHDARFDLYYLDTGTRHVFIGWRAPKSQIAKYQLEPAIEAAMGSVEITPSEEGPAGKKKRGEDEE